MNGPYGRLGDLQVGWFQLIRGDALLLSVDLDDIGSVIYTAYDSMRASVGWFQGLPDAVDAFENVRASSEVLEEEWMVLGVSRGWNWPDAAEQLAKAAHKGCGVCLCSFGCEKLTRQSQGGTKEHLSWGGFQVLLVDIAESQEYSWQSVQPGLSAAA